MKKYFLIFTVCLLFAPLTYSQVKISSEQLLGDWKIIKGEGKEFEEDVLGSIFHFEPSGKLTADKPGVNKDEPGNTKEGYWKLTNDTLVLYDKGDDIEKDKGLIVQITRYEGNILYIFDTEEKMTIVFERLKK